LNIPTDSFYSDSLAFFALPGQPPKFKLGYRPRLRLALLTSVRPSVRSFEAALAEHWTFRTCTLSNPNVHTARTVDSLSRPSINVLFGLQHAPEHLTLTDLWMLKQRDVQFIALAYDTANEYGGGFLRGSERLTGRGKRLIEWMAETGMILDISHTGHVTASGAIDYIRRGNLPVKVVATHSGCYSVCPHPRNLPDELLKELDYLGIFGVTFYTGPQGGDYLAAFTRHVEYAIQAVGKGKVGIGSDCPHVSMTMEEALEQYERVAEMLGTNGKFGEYFPDRPPEFIKHGASLFKVIEHRLAAEGVLQADPGVLGQNFKEFLSRSLPQV